MHSVLARYCIYDADTNAAGTRLGEGFTLRQASTAGKPSCCWFASPLPLPLRFGKLDSLARSICRLNTYHRLIPSEPIIVLFPNATTIAEP